MNTNCPDYLAITGGIGGAKLALGLTQILDSDQLAFLVNTGDDFNHLGLHISPDIDTLLYTLSGEANTDTGWGRRDESWNFMQALSAMGGEDWFQLGDRDLATHIERKRRLADGETLSEATAALAKALGVAHRVIPMSDDPVRTLVRTPQGVMDFQHYFVREQCAPEVLGFDFEGSDSARLNPLIDQWLGSADLKGIIICPSNPFVSIDPILSVPGLRETLGQCAAPVVAISPVVGGQAIKGPTVKMMRELGIEPGADWVAAHYRDFLDGFILDEADQALQPTVAAFNLEVAVTQTVMKSLDDRVALARSCLELLKVLHSSSRKTG